MWGPSIFRWFLDFIFPPICPICQTLLGEGEKGLIVCPDCQKGIRPVRSPYCPRCGLPFSSRDEEAHLCGHCLKEKRYFEVHRTCGLYEGALKEAIHRFKYQGEFSLVRFFGDFMHPPFQILTQEHPVDVIVPVPLHIRRLRERGFNQALLLARELSKRTGVPYQERALEKIKDTPFQITLKGKERRKNVKGGFSVAQKEAIAGKSIVLVDDVYTTGATVNECSHTLLTGGAERVAVLTVARTL